MQKFSGIPFIILGRTAALLMVFGGVSYLGCREQHPSETQAYTPPATQSITEQFDIVAHSQMPPPEGATCVDCHAEIVSQWEQSQHAHANRLLKDSPLQPGHSQYGDVETLITEELEIQQNTESGFSFTGTPVAVIGVEPLVQALVLTTNGRWQVANPAYHMETNGWFNAFPEVRNYKEWGHWNGRGMNWNVQCAWCHTTDFKKNYNPETDSYASEWKSMGISCTQCHTDLAAHAADPSLVPGKRFDPVVAQENCMTCHARRSTLTSEKFVVGEKFNDHFRLNLMDRPSVYYPDGQVRDEDFEAGSFLSSKMHDAGVTCLDCHNPHSGELKLPVENNLLCMSCHAAPGRLGATSIIPEVHSHHEVGSAGNRCVECHMPETMYMEADLRRDHGFTIPDPLLTRTLGIPNACSRCHSDESVEWAEKWTEEWYGDKLAARRTRPRAHAIQDAWDGKANLGPVLVQLAQNESNINWRASLIRLMGPYMDQQSVREFTQSSLRHPHELVRNAAVHALGDYPVFFPQIENLREDPSRLVRIDASWVTRDGDPFSPEQAKELDEWLTFNSDQPAGAMHLAQMALSKNDPAGVQKWAKRMVVYDASIGPYMIAGRLVHAAGLPEQAITYFEEAVVLDPSSEEAWYVLAMLRNELGNLDGAMDAFRKVVQLNVNNARAWYNLGLAQIQSGNVDAGLMALTRAEGADPTSADAAYAAATVYLQAGNIDEARKALNRALQANPQHGPTLQLLNRLQTGR
ncbi:tetratricopeptide repeat protein [Kiritimatiellota bacterium B12222]|nr:tetratricopeptide repeat protein [Kiritimatiellota bacterium B12222]